MNRKLALILLSLLLVVCTTATAQNAKAWLKDGNTRYAEGKYKEAAELYEKAANAGSAEAQCNLGVMYYEGEGVDKDFSSAAMWFKRAAKMRYAKAEYNLALCYMNGQGVPTSYDKALIYMKASAQRGYTEAQERLADLYAKGIMVEADMEESRRWLAMSRGEKVELAPEVERPTRLQTAPSDSSAAATAPTDVAQTAAPAAKTAAPAAPAVAAANTEAVPSTASPATPAKQQPLLAEATEPAAQAGPEIKKSANAVPEETEKEREANRKIQLIEMMRQQGLNVRAPMTAEEQASPNGAPIIKILYPEDMSQFHTDVVKLKYQLLAQGMESVTKITVMVDGVKQPETRAVKQANMIDVDVPNHDCTIMLFAQNENGNSIPATIRLVREVATQIDLPRLFAVAVGVGEYDDEKLPNLKMTTKDARDFAAAVSSKKGHPFSDVQVKLLCDKEAHRSDIFEAMEWMAQEARPNDLCMFFFAGHGYRDEKDRFYFMPYGGSTNRLYECFSASDFKSAAEDINSKFVIFADACYSAGLMEGHRSAAAQHFVEQLRRSKNGMVLYASSSGDTKSKEDVAWGNGAFTKSLIEAFNGAARQDGDEGLSTRALDSYLYDAVRKITEYKQTPIFMNPSGIEPFNIFTYDTQKNEK